MLFALALTIGFILFVWLVFFKYKWLKWSMAWALVSFFIFIHVLLIFLIGIRFVTPCTKNAVVVQHTIQLVPRLTEPTLVTAVLVEPDVPVKKGQPLFQFDRRPYEDKVRQLEAQLAAAKQNVLVLKADVEVDEETLARRKTDVEYDQYQLKVAKNLAATGAGGSGQVETWTAQLQKDEAGVSEADAELERGKLRYQSEIDGVNTTVAAMQAELDLARFYLDNTTLVAPEDGRIVNLQVRPGMVAGDVRFGAIASFICDDGRFLLASYSQEELKYVANGQPVEVALNLYPGQIFPAKVDAIWKANGDGQYLPSGNLPKFEPRPPKSPQNCYAVKIVFDDADQSKFPIGAQGSAAIYTNGLRGPWAALRRIGIRIYTWLNWLYPLPF
ncbi:MAG TPA: biotin/lipoyl-binding protein [Candidatus Acidoferrum sp.]|nr:biotin/lipoyl-binding protein [Candidatus Acidoferrum sp.]